MKIERISSDVLIVEKLQDGSTAIFHRETNTVYSLNETASAAWEACSSPATIGEICESMRVSLDAPVTEDTVLVTLDQLQRQGLLLKTAALPARASRRHVLAAAGIIAPAVLALTSAEQLAFAQDASSATTTPAASTTRTTTTTGTTSKPTTTVRATTTAS